MAEEVLQCLAITQALDDILDDDDELRDLYLARMEAFRAAAAQAHALQEPGGPKAGVSSTGLQCCYKEDLQGNLLETGDNTRTSVCRGSC